MPSPDEFISVDVVDWILDNLIECTRTRRGLLKKLKEMYLLTNYKGPKKSSGGGGRLNRQWGAEDEQQLRELFEQFKDAHGIRVSDKINGPFPEPRNAFQILSAV